MTRKEVEMVCRVFKDAAYRSYDGGGFLEIPSAEWMRWRLARMVCEAFNITGLNRAAFLKACGFTGDGNRANEATK